MTKIINVNDKFQKDYTYELVVPEGKSFAVEFNPQLTPKQMLELGVFGGEYFADRPSDLPDDWWQGAKLSKTYDKNLNYFHVSASQPLSVWKKKGWIDQRDPRGWFQWYCRYYMGRRIEDYDDWQIKRWKAIQRHIAQLQKSCLVGDLNCRPRQRQAILHWAYDSRKL
ncbi:MAG: hypothetical protein QG675_670 [Patescibacteria group bacterium]|jgi:hypothetical protein|nr:hypothetical protein [Patescibacteria group bacterium]